MYFVPGGRIGFLCPTEVKPWSNTWHLHSTDQTLQVQVKEALRIDEDWDDRLWQPNGYALVAAGLLSPGMEHRLFRDPRYDGDDSYGAEVHAFRDDRWIGQIKIATNTLGSPVLKAKGGQVARWRETIAALTASLTVRPSPSPSDAAAEFRISLPLDGLNPRFIGDQLVLSLAPPATQQQMSGVSGSYISITQLSLLPVGRPEELEQAKNDAFKIYSGIPGSRVIKGAPCRCVVLRENAITEGADATYATNVMVFGRIRELNLTAFYDKADRERILQALERVASALALPD